MKAVNVKRIEFNPEWLDDKGVFSNCPFAPKGEKYYGEYVITPDSNGVYALPGGATRIINQEGLVSMHARFQITNMEIIQSTLYNYSGSESVRETELVPAVVVFHNRFALSIRLGSWIRNSRPSKLNSVEMWAPVLRQTTQNPEDGYTTSWSCKGGKGTSFIYGRGTIPLSFKANNDVFWYDVIDITRDILRVTMPVEPIDTLELRVAYANSIKLPTVGIMASEEHLKLSKELAILRYKLHTGALASEGNTEVQRVITDICNDYNKATLALLATTDLDLDDLSGAETDVLYKLGTYGPQDDGGLSSKTGAADLMERGYLISDYSCEKNNQLTELGVAAYHRLGYYDIQTV